MVNKETKRELETKNLCFLYQYEEVKQVLTPAPFVSFCSARTPMGHLVRAKVYAVEERD